MVRKYVGIAVAKLVQETRRALHIREQEGDGAGWQLGHTVMMRRLEPKV
jgi:hypothetical protein